MKKGTFVFLVLVCSLVSSLADPVSLLVNPSFQGKDKDGLGTFALEIVQAELSGDTSLRLVDRKSLDQLLKEQGLGASGMADGETSSRIGKIFSANYLAGVKGIVAGERMMIVLRVVEVETSLFRSKTITVKPEDTAETIAKQLQKSIKSSIADMSKGSAGASKAPVEKLDIPKEAERPRIAIYIPEATDGQRARVDPACEHRLMDKLIENKFPISQLEYSSHAIAFGENGRPQGEAFKKLLAAAREKQVEILIVGEAFSQRAGTLGPLVSSRARVEFHSVRVSDQEVINSISRYGTAADTALAIAGKKAIEDATDRAFIPFVNEMMKPSE